MTTLTMATAQQADRSAKITARAAQLDIRRTARRAGLAKVLPMTRAAFQAAAEGAGWVFDGDLAIGPDGAVFVVS
jgi:hypothetical protein